MKKIYSIAIIAIIVAGVSACQKNDSSPANAKVSITLNSPQDGQTFRTGDTVTIDAEIKYEGELHGHEVKITDTASEMVLYDSPEHVHDDHFTVHEQWVNSTGKAAGLKLEMIAAMDDNGHDTEKVIHIVSLP